MTLMAYFLPETFPPFVLGCLVLLFFWLYFQAYGTDVPHIVGIPEPPGALPFVGHLRALGNDHASKLQEWATTNDWPCIQAKLGNRRILVLNTFAAAQDFIVKNATATIDRPLLYTFHSVLSTTQGATIGSSPWDESCKRRRTAVGAIMTRPGIIKSRPLLDLEISALIKDFHFALFDLDEGRTCMEIEPHIYFQRMALNLTLMMCYSTRIKCTSDPMLHELLHIAKSASTFRSTNNNLQDYVPIYRYAPENERSRLAIRNRVKRDKILENLLDKVKRAMDEGIPVPCLSQGLLSENRASKLTDAEIRSVNVSLVSGGFETLSTTGVAGLGLLASREGQTIQTRAHKAILEVYSSPAQAWDDCLEDERVPYVVALVREMLRYYAPIPLLPPRQTCKAFEWQGIRIPEKVVVIQNAQAINHDKTAYGPDADRFSPERWLDESSSYKVGPPYHYSFGAGSRMCTAVILSNRILYALFVRLILHFEFSAAPNFAPTTNYVDINDDTTSQTVTVRPYRITMKERYPRAILMSNLERSDKATRGIPIV